jgi:hypothetical protein
MGRLGISAALSLVALTASSAPVFGQIIRVEQDWKLVLNQPDYAVEAPQFHTVMSPSDNLDGSYAQVTWNYREYPEFSPGGLQVQAWSSDNVVETNSTKTSSLSTVAETITWTQTLQTDGVALEFNIINGRSTTWGSFGGHHTETLWIAYVPDLGAYDTNVTAQNSWITFGDNRVDQLVVTEVRYYDAGGLVSTDTNDVVIFEIVD